MAILQPATPASKRAGMADQYGRHRRRAAGRDAVLFLVVKPGDHTMASLLRTAEERIQKWLCVQARYRRRFCQPLRKLFRRNAALVTGTACLENRLFVCCLALLEAGQ